jgi:anti-anti-sigma regulatory factor
MPQYRSAICTVTVSDPSSARVVEICVAGELDHAAAPMLTEIIDYLHGLDPLRVVVDVSELGFAGLALPNWVARLRDELQCRPCVVIRDPQPIVGRLLAVTDMTHLVDDTQST